LCVVDMVASAKPQVNEVSWIGDMSYYRSIDDMRSNEMRTG